MCKSYFSRKEVELKTDNMLISSFKIAFVFELLQSYECFIYIKNMLCKKKKKTTGTVGEGLTIQHVESQLLEQG